MFICTAIIWFLDARFSFEFCAHVAEKIPSEIGSLLTEMTIVLPEEYFWLL